MELTEATSLETSLQTDVDGWTEYKEKYNIIPGSPAENLIMQKAFELDIAKKNKDLIQQQVQTLKSPANDLDKLLSLGYQAYGVLTVGPKLKEAGSAYSRIGAKRTFKVNELAKLKKQQEFNWALEGYKHQNTMNQIRARGIETRKNQQHKADLDAAAGTSGSIYDIFKNAIPKAFDFKNYDLSAENLENQEFNLLDNMQIDRSEAVGEIANKTVNFLNLVQSMPDEFKGSQFLVSDSLGTNFKYTVNGQKKEGSLEDMIADLDNPENEAELDLIFNHFKNAISDTINKGYRSEIPGDLNSPLINQDILINPHIATLNNKPDAYMSLLSVLGDLELTKGSFVHTEKEYNRILKNLQAENVTDIAVNQNGFPPIIQTLLQKQMGLNGESIKTLLELSADPEWLGGDRKTTNSEYGYELSDSLKAELPGQYSWHSDSTYVVLDKETFADQVVSMATNKGDVGAILDYLNKNHKYASKSTGAAIGRFYNPYNPNKGHEIQIFEDNPLFAQSFFWYEQDPGGYAIGLEWKGGSPGVWMFEPKASRTGLFGPLNQSDNDKKIQALREIAYEAYDGIDNSEDALPENRLSDSDDMGMIQNLQILMKEHDAPGKYSFNYKDFMNGNLPQMGQDVRLDPIMDAYFDNEHPKYTMVNGQKVPTDATHFVLNMAEVLRSGTPGKQWQAYIPSSGETGFGTDVNAIINEGNTNTNKVMEQLIDMLLMSQKNDTNRSIFDLSWSKTGSNEVGQDGEYTHSAYKITPNPQMGDLVQDILLTMEDFSSVEENAYGVSKLVFNADGLKAYRNIMSNGIVMYMDKTLDNNRNMDDSNAVDQLAKYIMTSEEPYRMELPNAGVSVIEHIGGGQFKVRVQDYMWNSDSLAIIPSQIIPDERIYRSDQILKLKSALELHMVNVAKQNIAAENEYKNQAKN